MATPVAGYSPTCRYYTAHTATRTTNGTAEKYRVYVSSNLFLRPSCTLATGRGPGFFRVIFNFESILFCVLVGGVLITRSTIYFFVFTPFDVGDELLRQTDHLYVYFIYYSTSPTLFHLFFFHEFRILLFQDFRSIAQKQRN